MKITLNELHAAAVDAGLTREEASKLWNRLEERAMSRPGFDMVHVLYYAGALTVIAAMTIFMTTAWSLIGASALFTFAALYFILFLMLAEWMSRRPGLKVPAGLVATMAVAMVPLVIYAVQEWFQLWPDDQKPLEYREFHIWVRGMWFQMEIWTLIAGALILARYKYPFIVMPMAVCLWYLSMDIAPLILAELRSSSISAEEHFDFRKLVSLIFGAGMLTLAYAVDRRTKLDYAFWFYFFGLISFWGSLMLLDRDNELTRFMYAMVNVGLIGLGVFLSRKIFLVFGGIGICLYIGHLAVSVFDNSLLFPMIVAALGLGIVGLGFALYRHGKRWESAILATLPPWMLNLRPQQRELSPLDPAD